jgi:hypothetical protein
MPRGRPPKVTPKVIEQIAQHFLYGFSDEETALLVDLDRKTIQRMRAGSLCPAIKRAEQARKAEYINRITEGTRPDWARWAWFLERRFPLQFSKPEIQLAVNTGPTINQTLVISAEVAGVMASRFKPAEQKIDALLKAKRGNGASNGHQDKLSDGNH